jgi:hypothetical protein
MATVEEYLTTSYEADREYVDDELHAYFLHPIYEILLFTSRLSSASRFYRRKTEFRDSMNDWRIISRWAFATYGCSIR